MKHISENIKKYEEVLRWNSFRGVGTIWARILVVVFVYVMFNLKPGENYVSYYSYKPGEELTSSSMNGFIKSTEKFSNWEEFVEQLIHLSIRYNNTSFSIDWEKQSEPVLLIGETGTGKTSIANYIHLHSARRDKKFVIIIPGVLSSTLVDSELFGHERGAFTGAYTKREGKLEYARGGTAFFDDLLDSSYESQGRLLRALEQHEFERVGGNKIIRSDIRIIAAINMEPQLAVERGKLRDDLYYRLSTIELRLPPLRNYKELIPQLAQILLREIDKRVEYTTIGELSNSVIKKLLGYNFPGNIRELEEILARAVLFAHGKRIEPKHIILPKSYNSTKIVSSNDVISALIACNDNKTNAAKRLGISRPKLYDLMRKYNIPIDCLRDVEKCRKMSGHNFLQDKKIDVLHVSKVSEDL